MWVSAPDDLLAFKFSIVFPHLNEHQRRIVSGAEAQAIGRGGIPRVAEATGMSRSTVQKAVGELNAGLEVSDRVRRSGGGRSLFGRATRALSESSRLWSSPPRGGTSSPRCGGRLRAPGSLQTP